MASPGFIDADSGRRCGEGTPDPPSRSMLNRQPNLSPRTPVRASPFVGACFTCKKEGHWSRDCPSRKSPSSTSLGVDDGRTVVPECPCGAGRCLQLTSETVKNPGRKFFRCPAKSPDKDCRFFQWCDSLSPYQPVVAPVNKVLNLGTSTEQQATTKLDDYHPLCQCGAGWCIILGVKEGEHAGRKYFCCPRKKNDEKCNFKQWCDEVTGKSKVELSIQDLVNSQSGSAHYKHPDCACGAGKCRLLTVEHGENKGRKYFACTVKKGQGACNFFQWLDAEEVEQPNAGNHLVGNNNHYPDLARRPREKFHVEPTLPDYDHVGVRETNAALPPTLDRRRGDHTDSLNQNPGTRIYSSRLDVLPRPGKCYRCGREGHWMVDCVEPLSQSSPSGRRVAATEPWD